MGDDKPSSSTNRAVLLVHPTQILPVKLWENVLEYLGEDPRDLINASQTCALFASLLSKKLNGCRLEEVIPLVLRYLTEENEILNCRMISKRVTNCIDKMFDKLHLVAPLRHVGLHQASRWMPPRSSPFYESDRFGDLQQMNFRIHVNTLSQWDKIQNEMEEISRMSIQRRKIFLRRGLCLELTHMPEPGIGTLLLERSLNVFQKLLTFKNQLKVFEWNDIYTGTSAILMYQTARKLLQALPNLESFEIFWMKVELDGEENEEWESNTMSELQDYIVDHPLPEMSNLKHISLWGEYPPPLFLEMCRKYGSQLISLGFINNETRSPAFSFPVLTHLRIARRMRNDILLPTLDAPRVIHLELEYQEGISEMEPASNPFLFPEMVLQFLNNFPNLISLVLFHRSDLFRNHFHPGNQIFGLGTYSNVKHLQLRDLHGLEHPLSVFTDIFPNLETFKMNVWSRPSEADWRLLCNGRGYELGIWKKMQFLSSFQVSSIQNGGEVTTNACYTREGYLDYQNRSVGWNFFLKGIWRSVRSFLGGILNSSAGEGLLFGTVQADDWFVHGLGYNEWMDRSDDNILDEGDIDENNDDFDYDESEDDDDFD